MRNIEYFCWHDYYCISRGYFLLRNDKRKLSILTKFWQLWKLWWNHMSILANVRSKFVLFSNNIIFNQCFQFWKQGDLFASRKKQFKQFKQEHIIQITLQGWYSMQQKLKAISLGKKAMKLCQDLLSSKTATGILFQELETVASTASN